MAEPAQDPHPDFAMLATSWDMSMEADGYGAATRRGYGKALGSFVAWLTEHSPGTGPATVVRDDVRGWLVELRRTRAQNTARTYYAGVRHFFRWLHAEGETDRDPCEGIRSPSPAEPVTEVIAAADLRRLVETCAGRDFVSRRDRAILLLFLDGGLRLAELAELSIADVDVRERMVYVVGKGSGRSGPRHRAVPLGIKAAQALDRYLRERRRHPWASCDALWLGARGRGPITAAGIKRMLQRRGESVGLTIHPHMLRHVWAHEFRAAGGSEGDLMLIGGWKSRAMLDRYGRSAAAERARDAARRYSLGDRL
ncbi:MAG TPA: tyrosine-type recombinase/integrase [Egibacteraceae bacterium]|nr:tyrosine-type recombinase/integrase [Egibacteraceae bacterium]